MAKPFPDDPFLRGRHAPLSMEADAPHLPVTGELPPEMRGTLYRNGPNPQFAPLGRYDWFAGDGMVHAFHIAEGNVSYRNRWVRTPKFELERAEGRGLSAGSMGPSLLTDPRLAELRSTTANTNVVWHGGRLLALEEWHAPFELDPSSLASKGSHTYEGRLSSPMTAHPKIDPISGEMVGFAYSTRGPFSADMMLQVVAADGRLTRSEHFVAPYPSMVHDFAVTRSHIVLPVFPLIGSLERARTGRPPYAWEPERGTHVGIMRRDAGVSTMRWFSGPPGYIFHFMNAYDTPDGKVVVDGAAYEAAPRYPWPDGSAVKTRQVGARLVRWTFDPKADAHGFAEQPLADIQVEFPRIDERFAMQPYRHGWVMSREIGPAPGAESDRDSIAHIDLATRRVSIWHPGLGDFASEPVFVPRAPDAPEGEGWILTVIYRGAENRSDLAVFDAQHLADGPLALAHLSHHVPAGFHGNWLDGDAQGPISKS